MDYLQNKCRICLEENNSNQMFELFDGSVNSRHPSDQNLSLNEKVELCCRVKMRQSTDMPSSICQKCYDMVYYWIHFQNICWDSQVYLESISYENNHFEKDFNQIYDNLIISSSTNLYKLKPSNNHNNNHIEHDLNSCASDRTSNEELDENYQVNDEDEIVSRGEKVCLAFEDNSLSGLESNYKADEDDEEEAADEEEEFHEEEMAELPKDKPKKKRQKRDGSPTAFMCNICGNVYAKKSTFAYHMSTHDDIRPHECEVCGKTFRQVCELKNHIRRHTGEKPFKCSYCNRNFIDRSEKHRHERTHTNDRPYKCKICGKSFAYSAILKNHSKLHSGEKAYSCLVCEKSFTLQHQLKAHLNTTIHKNRESEYITAGYEVLYE